MESKEFAEGRELFLDTLQKMGPDAELQKVIDGLRVPVRAHEPNVMVIIDGLGVENPGGAQIGHERCEQEHWVTYGLFKVKQERVRCVHKWGHRGFCRSGKFWTRDAVPLPKRK